MNSEPQQDVAMYGESPKEYSSPLEKNDHPEIDETPELSGEGIRSIDTYGAVVSVTRTFRRGFGRQETGRQETDGDAAFRVIERHQVCLDVLRECASPQGRRRGGAEVDSTHGVSQGVVGAHEARLVRDK